MTSRIEDGGDARQRRNDRSNCRLCHGFAQHADGAARIAALQ
jgi:nitrate/TMAO reductase-like tetraheme cytochrome c subunit